MEIEKPKKTPSFYECKVCDFSSCNKKDYKRHVYTRKHIDSVAGNNGKLSETPKTNHTTTFNCDCSREYKTLSGLWKHKKLCNFIEKHMDTNSNIISAQITPELVLNILEQNKELTKELTNLVLEQSKTIMELTKIGHGQTINSHNVNSNNKTFNLNVFLNEYCKDAMNITDFVDSLKLQVADLENMGKVGFVEGITSIIVKNLQALDIYKRPVHCADKKREVIYIKDEDKWEKETDEKNKIRKAIKRVADKNQRLLSKYREAHPGCNYAESKYSDIYNKIVIEALGGMGDNDAEKEDKIIRNIAKEVVIDKKN
jgi:hypothetical protein